MIAYQRRNFAVQLERSLANENVILHRRGASQWNRNRLNVGTSRGRLICDVTRSHHCDSSIQKKVKRSEGTRLQGVQRVLALRLNLSRLLVRMHVSKIYET